MDTKGKHVDLRIVGSDGVMQRVQATYYEKKEDCYLLYQEPSEEPGEQKSVSCRVKFKPGYLELTRSGSTRMQMICEEGNLHPVQYPTPYGMMQLKTRTDKVQILRTERETVVKATYALLQEEQEIQKVHLKLFIG